MNHTPRTSRYLPLFLPVAYATAWVALAIYVLLSHTNLLEVIS